MMGGALKSRCPCQAPVKAVTVTVRQVPRLMQLAGGGVCERCATVPAGKPLHLAVAALVGVKVGAAGA